MPERTPDGMHQRKSADKQQFEKYELLEVEDETPIGDLKVILLEDIEGTLYFTIYIILLYIYFLSSYENIKGILYLKIFFNVLFIIVQK